MFNVANFDNGLATIAKPAKYNLTGFAANTKGFFNISKAKEVIFSSAFFID